MNRPSRILRGPGCRTHQERASRTPPCCFRSPARVGASRSGRASTRTSAITRTMPTKLRTLMSNTTAALVAVRMAPASIGPKSRATLNCAELSAMAEGSSSRDTSAGTSACQAGITAAHAAPSRKARVIRPGCLTKPRRPQNSPELTAAGTSGTFSAWYSAATPG